MTKGREPTYERRELVYIGFMRLAAVAMFAGLIAIAGDPFSPELVVVIILAVPYSLWTMWLGARRWETFDARILIPLDLIVIGTAVLIGEGPESQATVIYFIWTIAMAILYPPRVALGCAALAIVGASIASIPAIAADPALWKELFLVDAIIAWMALITWCVSDVFRRRASDIERLSATRRRLLTDALGAEERARRRLSDALQHDALQVLLSAGQDLDAARGGHPWIASRARERIRLAVRSLRETVRTLHPAAIAEAGLAAGIDCGRRARSRRQRHHGRRPRRPRGRRRQRRAPDLARARAHARRCAQLGGVADRGRRRQYRRGGRARRLGQPRRPGRAQGGDPGGRVGARLEPREGRGRRRRDASWGRRVRRYQGRRDDPLRGWRRIRGSARRLTYGRRELRYFALARLAAMPLFTILNAVAGAPIDVDFVVAVVLSMIYGVALLWFAFSRYWDRIDARWFAAADLICLGAAITVTGGPESELRAAFFAWPIALSMLFPPRIVWVSR